MSEHLTDEEADLLLDAVDLCDTELERTVDDTIQPVVESIVTEHVNAALERAAQAIESRTTTVDDWILRSGRLDAARIVRDQIEKEGE